MDLPKIRHSMAAGFALQLLQAAEFSSAVHHGMKCDQGYRIPEVGKGDSASPGKRRAGG
jgi:hypothetical protein